VEELQRVIESSMATASPLARRIYSNHRWSAVSAQRFINKVMAATVATVRQDGRPHATVVLTACLGGTVHFAVSRGSVLLHTIEHRPAVAMTIIDRDHDVTLFGESVRLGTAGDLPDLVSELHALSRRGQFTPRDWNGFLYAVTLERIFLSA
jgi:pyridoxine/pyridoxamine 5'-phosphate oxidase